MPDLREGSLRRVRYRDDVGFEMLCDRCGDWWPLTTEFWYELYLSRCLACKREVHRLGEAARRQTPEYQAQMAEERKNAVLREKRREISLRYRNRHLEEVRRRGRERAKRIRRERRDRQDAA